MKNPVYITSIASISALGYTEEEVSNNYQKQHHHFISLKDFKDSKDLICQLDNNLNKKVDVFRTTHSKYKSLDRSVILALMASREAIKRAGWHTGSNFGINIGSSRGATTLFEKFHAQFLSKKSIPTITSPTTTLGNISSWVAQDLQTSGPEISHSITCSTSLHSVLNAIAWLNSGMSDSFLVGGSEAPLTEFTIEQMKALRIYAKKDEKYPCRAMDIDKNQNSMVLGEAGVSMCLERSSNGKEIAKVVGLGYATEQLESSTSISADAQCFQKSMQLALNRFKTSDIDIIVTHTPGTIKGDRAEIEAIKKVFGKNMPAMTNNKWKIGHTLGSSGLMSVEMAVIMLKKQTFFEVPFLNGKSPRQIRRIMVNSVGFGGNAVSLVLEGC